MEQPEALMEDLKVIAWRKKRMTTLLENSGIPAGASRGQVRKGVADKAKS